RSGLGGPDGLDTIDDDRCRRQVRPAGAEPKTSGDAWRRLRSRIAGNGAAVERDQSVVPISTRQCVLRYKPTQEIARQTHMDTTSHRLRREVGASRLAVTPTVMAIPRKASP